MPYFRARLMLFQMPKLHDIEADAIHHLQERADLVNKRRTADDDDDLALCMAVAAPIANDEDIDDMGRSRRDQAGPSSGVRRARRNERQNRRFRRRTSSARPPEDDGFSTDTTLAEGDERDYAAAQGVLDHRVAALLDDVKAEDFRDPEKGLAVRFGEWRSRYEEEYVNAFGGLAMVQAWEFWARGGMVNWEPLRVNGLDPRIRIS